MTKPRNRIGVRIHSTWILALLILLAGCFPDYLPSRHLKRQLSRDEIVGTWRLTEKTVQFFKGMELLNTNVEGTITFLVSGDCNFSTYGEVAERFIAVKGQWRLEYGESPAGEGKINTVWIKLEGRNASGGSPVEMLYATAHRGTIRLWSYMGDPDARRFLEYEKQGP